MKTKLIAVAALLALPSMAAAQSLGEILQGITDPHIVGAVSYNNETKEWAAVLTANVVGPKLGTLPCYISGAGVALNTIAPGLEDAPIAAWSFPLLTCAPFGEQVAIQAGLSTPLNGPGGKSYYAGLGVSVGGGPNTLKVKRVKRAEAKAAKKAAELLLLHPPGSVVGK
jgi:hypothetical protein